MPPKNIKILAFKWVNNHGDVYRDYEEINSNDYEPCKFDGWEFIKPQNNFNQ